LNATHTIVGIDHEKSICTKMDFSDAIMGFRYLTYKNGCMGSHKLARDAESSTAPVQVSKPTAPCGDLWEYLKFNYAKFLQEQGLFERFLEFGETEAQRISECFKDLLFINECPLCGNIKKTPRARLCLKCGDFTFPNS
jgi:hypothetical protein